MNDFSFSLSDKQAKKALEWIKDRKADKRYGGAIRGRFSYTFAPTTLGLVCIVRDDLSGEEIDLSDYEGW